MIDYPGKFLTNFTIDVCIPILENKNNGQKPTLCAYTSLFVEDYLYKVKDDQNSKEVYSIDYCSNLIEGID